MHKSLKILFLVFLITTFDVYTQENELQHFSIADGLSSNTIKDIAQDEIGYLWLITNKGYTKYDGIYFTHYEQADANCIFIDKNKVYIGLKKGLLILQNDKTSFYESKEVLKIKSIHNKIIIATVQGICELKEDYILPLKINTQIDFSIINDVTFLKNTIYIASNKGLWGIDQFYKPKKIIKIANNNCNSFLINNKTVIASTLESGLKVIENNTLVKSIPTLAKSTSLHKLNTEIWVVSKENGIEVIELNNYTFKRKINKYNATISNKINTVFKDSQNTVWIASNNKGLYTYNSKKDTVAPKIYIENVLVNYKAIDTINSQKLTLKPNENNISFSFKTVILKGAKNIEYQYQLNNEINPWSSQTNVNFANLKAGKYTFVVQSKNGELFSNKKHFHFFIETPIYKKAWFYILCGVFLCLLFAGIIDLYIRKLNTKNQQKIERLKVENHVLTLEQKALQLQMNPHFIFNVLNGIKALGNSGNSKELNKTISQFSILLRSVLNNSRLEEVSLQEEIETLKNYLNLEQKMNANSFEYLIETSLKNIDSEEILIPPMLLQPFLENSIKHAFKPNATAPKIKLNIQIKQQFLLFKIEDNGIGFYQSKKENVKTDHQSIALEVTKERLQHLSKYNSFSIEEITTNNKVSGTKISFKIPLKTDY